MYKTQCDAPMCKERTGHSVVFKECKHDFYFCAEHMIQFGNVLMDKHVGYCADCGTEFDFRTAVIFAEGDK
jgi:hypothetical protein